MNINIVIQGQTKYCKETLNNFSQKHSIIYSTWDDEPLENLEFIKSLDIKLILNKKPEYSGGGGNVNYQSSSAYNGILNSNSNYIFKIRSDMVFTNIDLLLEKIYNIYRGNLIFFDFHIANSGHPFNYFVDFFCFGSKEEQLILWNYQRNIDGSNNIHNVLNPETRLLLNYLNKKGLPSNLENINEALYNFDYFFNIIDDETDIFWLSHGEPKKIRHRLWDVSGTKK